MSGFKGSTSDNKDSTLGSKDDRAPTTRSSVPTNVDVPYASQDAGVLNCTMGNWNGEPTSYKYKWTVGDSTLPTSDTAEHTLAAEDVGKTVSCVVTATNDAGSTTAPPSNSFEVAPFITEGEEEDAQQFYFQDSAGTLYKAAERRNPGDSTILFPGPDIEQHLSRDATGKPVDTQATSLYDASQLTAATEALKYNPRNSSIELAKSIQDANIKAGDAITDAAQKKAASVKNAATEQSSGTRAPSTTGIQNSNTAAASGNIKVSQSRS